MVSYEKLFAICNENNYGINGRSLLNYTRDFKNFLVDQEINLQHEVKAEIFRVSQNPKKPLSPSQKSAVVFFYKIYLRFLLHEENLSLRTVLKISQFGIYDMRFAKYFDMNLLSYDYILECANRDIKSRANLERLLYLPGNTLINIHSNNKCKSLIPDEWWPERLKSPRNYKHDHIRNIWLAENNLPNDEGHKRFLDIIQKVDDGMYSTGRSKVRRDYT